MSKRVELAAVRDPGPVFRVGYGPDPWVWTDWRYAHNGRFDGRWDAEDGAYRTVYAGNTIQDCFVEVLARFRPDPGVVAARVEIDVDPTDESRYATVAAGVSTSHGSEIDGLVTLTLLAGIAPSPPRP